MAGWSLLHLHRYDQADENQGQRYHRVDNASSLINADGRLQAREISWLHPQAVEMACAANLLVIHALDDLALHGIVAWRRKRGLATLFELPDDPSAPAPWRKRRQTPSPLELNELYNLAAQCDGVQFSSAGLQERFGILCERTCVLPNAVEIPDVLPEKADGFVVGWAGTASHREDLHAIAPVLEVFCRRHGDVRVALKGDPGMLREVFAGLPEAQVAVEPFGSPESYRAFLRALHVGLAPLGLSAFNLGRSDVKLFEYAAAGAVAVAQDAPAYRAHAAHVLLFESADRLLDQFEALYAQRELLRQFAADLHAYAFMVRSPESVRRLHVEWYLSHLGAEDIPRAVPHVSSEAESAFRTMCALDGEDVEAGLRDVLERLPEYVQVRLRLAALLGRSGRTEEAERVGKPLRQSCAFHDPYLMLVSRWASPERAALLREELRLPIFRALAERVSGAEMERYTERVLAAAPYHFFALSHRMRSEPVEPEERERLQRRLALFAAAGASVKQACL